MTALKSIVPEQFFVIKKFMQEITDPNHESANSTYVAMLREQREFLKEEQFLKNSISLSPINMIMFLIVLQLITVIIIVIVILITIMMMMIIIGTIYKNVITIIQLSNTSNNNNTNIIVLKIIIIL